MYSCALWSEEEGGVRGDLIQGPTEGDLEAAQMRKIHHVLQAARLKPGDRVLEFGTGWGALAIEVRAFSPALAVARAAAASESARRGGDNRRFSRPRRVLTAFPDFRFLSNCRRLRRTGARSTP